MDFLSAFTDDQIALIGCVLALGTAFAVMSLTWNVRQAIQPKDAAASAFLPRTSAKPNRGELHQQDRRAA